MVADLARHPLGSEMGRLAAAIDSFCEHPVPRSGPDLVVYLTNVRQSIDNLELKFSEGAAAFATTDEYEEQGSTTPINWIRIHCHMGGGTAADRVAVGEQLERIPESHQSVLEGQIGFAHLALIARTAEAIADSGTNKSFDEAPLLEKARDFSVGRFRVFCNHARHAADPDGYTAEQTRGVETRSLSLSSGEDGRVWLRGVLDAEGGAAVRTALEPLAQRSGAGDDRKWDRRLADALVELAHHSLDNGLVPRRATQRPHLQVTTTLETLLQRVGAPAADLEFSLPISAKAVERLACDCNVTRILLGSDSAVIDVGRSKRVINPAQKRALNVRDKGCCWPGCERPPSWTSGHHLVHWIRGGTTDLAHLVLLCHRHHWMVHEGRWQLVKKDDGQILTLPPSLATYQQFTRGPNLSPSV